MIGQRIAWAVFGLVAAAHLVCLAAGVGVGADITQVAAMPALAAVLFSARLRGRLVTWTLAGLAGSWLGDSVPRLMSGDAAFLAMVGGFLLAQVAYSIGFWPARGRSILAIRRGALAPYLAVFAALVALCLPGAGALAPAVVVYGAMLVTTAVLATGINAIAWWGGALFLVSDGMIALHAFSAVWPLDGRVQSIAVMVTYFVAEALLIGGVIRRVRAGRSSASRSPAVSS